MEQYTIQCQECKYQEPKIFHYFGLAQTIAESHANKKGHKTEILYKGGGKAIMHPKGIGQQKNVRKGFLEMAKQWVLSVVRRFKGIN